MSLSTTPSIQNADFAKLWWLERHDEKLAEVKARQDEVKLVFLGDSITHAWEDLGASVWEHHYAPLGALNLGYAGDRTENVLWRLAQGEVEALSPDLVVLQIGTNNTGHRKDPPEETAAGIEAILNTLRTELPHSKILVLAIFPRGRWPDDPLRQLNHQVNLMVNHTIQALADNHHIFFLDINQHFLDEHGELHQSVMEDRLHPNASQYQVWADAMAPTLRRLLNSK